MIRDLNLSYKQCKSRPFTFNIAKARASRKLFWACFAEKLESSALIINVDESTFGRTSKINYSWSKKGEWAELKNTPFCGSTSMILAILSNGWWMCLITPQTINSDIFIMFVSKLKEWISKKINLAMQAFQSFWIIDLPIEVSNRRRGWGTRIFDCIFTTIQSPASANRDGILFDQKETKKSSKMKRTRFKANYKLWWI